MGNDRFTELLTESVRSHGHLCPGQVLGVRMAVCGLKAIGINDPKGTERKKHYLIAEIDRCITGALQTVTGCSLSLRTLKFMDYGKMAATFVNLATGDAVRLLAREEAPQKASEYFPAIETPYLCQIEAYKIMPDEELFDAMLVSVTIPSWDLPWTKPPLKVKCDLCGEYVHDGREIDKAKSILCRACVEGGYYYNLGTISTSPCAGVEKCRLAS